MTNDELQKKSQELYDTVVDALNQMIRLGELEACAEKKAAVRWKPEPDSIYFTASSDGQIWGSRWSSSGGDDRRYAVANVYRTREEAQQAIDDQLTRVRILDRIAELNDGWEHEGGCNHWFPYQLDCASRAQAGCWKTPGISKDKMLVSKSAAEKLLEEFTAEELRLVYW